MRNNPSAQNCEFHFHRQLNTGFDKRSLKEILETKLNVFTDVFNFTGPTLMIQYETIFIREYFIFSSIKYDLFGGF